MLTKTFVAPALPLPARDLDQQTYQELIRVLRIYFNQLDDYLNSVNTELVGAMEPFSATSLDAFGRLRISQPYTLFDSQNRFQKDPQFAESLAGNATATYNGNESTVDMAVTTTTNDEAIRQTYRVFPYQPGKSLQLLATFAMASGATGLVQRVGYFNTGDGVFFQKSGDTLSFVLRSSTSGTPSDVRTVAQSSWNGDKLDGTGASGIILDTTKTQILYLDFEWLGVGSIRCGFIIDGTFIICHTFNNANDQTKVYMKTAILPVRYEIKNSASAAGTMKQICSTVISEGGYDQKSNLTWARMTADTAVSTSFEPLVSIQIKSGSVGAVVLPAEYKVLPVGATADFEIALIKNPTLTGASFTSNSTNVNYDTSATALTGGTIVQTSYTAATNQSTALVSPDIGYNFDLQLGVDVSGNSDIYTLAARTLSGTDDIIGSLGYYDLTD